MAEELVEKYQVAGLDDRERGFNRPVSVHYDGRVYRATLQYEQTRLAGESSETKDAALGELVHALHGQGYRQLRSQLSFRGKHYLGNQEPWVDYQDPDSEEGRPGGLGGLVSRIMRLFGRSA